MTFRGRKSDETAPHNNILKHVVKCSSTLRAFFDRRRNYKSHDIQKEMLQFSGNNILRQIGKRHWRCWTYWCHCWRASRGRWLADVVVHSILQRVAWSNKNVIGLQLRKKCSKHFKRNSRHFADWPNTCSWSGVRWCKFFMRGEHAVVQKRIRRVAPSAVYVHCNAHCLALALQDAAGKVPLAVVQECSVFIHMSGNRQQ